MSNLRFDQKVRVISCLVEGNSIRSTERLCKIHRDTILRHLVAIGEGCNRLHDVLMTDLHCNLLELDEVWSFLGKKQKRVKPQDPAEMGDQYVFTAIDATRKAIISYAIGKRDGDTADAFALDLRSRIVNRPQISTDGYRPYLDAIEQAFGDGVDYAMIFKEYGRDDGDDHKYSPPKCIASEKRRISGSPEMESVSTSYVERSNLTLRMGCRRFTRLTNGYSKKLRNHGAAVGLSIAYYNMCRIHETVKTTPAVAIGAANHVWTIAELIDAALSILPDPEPGDDTKEAPILTPPPSPPALPAISPVLPAHVTRNAAAQRQQAIAVIKQLSLFPESVMSAIVGKKAV